MSDDDDNSNKKTDELNMINERRTDEMIVSQAILGKNLHDVYFNERISLALRPSPRGSSRGSSYVEQVVPVTLYSS